MPQQSRIVRYDSDSYKISEQLTQLKLTIENQNGKLEDARQLYTDEEGTVYLVKFSGPRDIELGS